MARPAAVALSWASTLLAQATYNVTDVGNLPGGAYVYPSALNERGDATGFSSSSTNGRAFLYTDAGGLQDLGVLPGASGSGGYAVNELRQVVGQSGTNAFRWTPGPGMQDLLPGVDAYALGANNRGDVVGWMRPTPTAQETPFLYNNGTVTQIINGAYGWALDINENGVVIGTWGGLGGSTWDPVSGSQSIPTLPGYPTNYLGAINDQGVVAGRGWSSSGTGAWFRYTPGVGIVNLGSVAQGLVSDINNHGDVVGSSAGSSGRAYLYTDQNGFQNLNTLIPSSPGWVLLDAVAINDAGQILCRAVGGPTCCTRTVRLDPVVRSAVATPLGVGCGPGTTPPLLSAPPPVLGGNLSLTLTNATPNTVGILVGSLGFPVPAPLGSCTVFVDQFAVLISLVLFTDASGSAGFSTPIAGQALSGLPLTMQMALLGTAAPPGVDLSNGMLLLLGN